MKITKLDTIYTCHYAGHKTTGASITDAMKNMLILLGVKQ